MYKVKFTKMIIDIKLICSEFVFTRTFCVVTEVYFRTKGKTNNSEIQYLLEVIALWYI